MTTKVPHKHAELIKAWADGATIETHTEDRKYYNDMPQSTAWYTVSNPVWDVNKEYRIKSDPKSYAEINFDGMYSTINVKPYNYYSNSYHEKHVAASEAVIQEFCKRNNLNRSEMK